MAYNHGYYSAPPQVAPAYPAYGAPAHQPAYAAYAQPVAAPPPPPVSAAEAFRHFFRSHLATLTFNSRPVINHLTQLALDQTANFENAVVVSEEIAKGIFEVRSPASAVATLTVHACMRIFGSLGRQQKGSRMGPEKSKGWRPLWRLARSPLRALCCPTVSSEMDGGVSFVTLYLAVSALHACRPP
jgi:hypothetical protein